MSEDAREMGYPLEHPHKLCCLRQELVDSFVESRYMTFIKVAAYHLQKFGFKTQIVEEQKIEEPAKENSEDESQGNKTENVKVPTEGDEDSNNAVEFVENITKSPEKAEG